MTVARALLSDAVRGGLLITLKLGEMPAHIPGWRACTRHGAAMADRIDGGALDRLLRHHGGALRAVRACTARARRGATATSSAPIASTMSNSSAASPACCACA